jgi:methionyl-tRNA synthetase
MKTFYLTTTLPYVNAPLHMGHALEFVRADAIVRYKIQQGFDVFFNTGTDEHGQKIYTKALEAGKDPQAFVDAGFETFKKQVASFGVTDAIHFVRTTDEHHILAAQEFWKRVEKNGYIYKKIYQAKYCVGCEEEKTDSQLVDGKCPLHPDLELESINEENYFFRFSAFQERLQHFFDTHPNFVIPEFRYNETKSFLSRGLEDFSISRVKEKMSWGIPVPGDDSQVMYVWFDALTNYISTLGWPENTDQFEKYWINGTPTQYCGKDNNRFQALMWQAMLMAAELPNSYQIVINGHITAEGGVKMSKSLGNVVDPLEIADKYGTDALRMFLLKEISSFEDSPFTMERFEAAYNAHLANGLGNLVSRILTLSEKYCDPFVSKEGERVFPIENELEAFDVQKAMNVIWNAIGELDAKIAAEKPFSVVKEDEAKGKEMITGLVADLHFIASGLKPFLPTTSEKILDLIAQNKKPETPLFKRLD